MDVSPLPGSAPSGPAPTAAPVDKAATRRRRASPEQRAKNRLVVKRCYYRKLVRRAA